MYFSKLWKFRSKLYFNFYLQTIFFEIFLNEDYDDYDYEGDEDYQAFKDGLEKDDYEGDIVKGLTDSMLKIKQNHGKTLKFQAVLRAFEAKDRNVIEHNYERVNFWSMIHLVAMIGTAVFQVTINQLWDMNYYTACHILAAVLDLYINYYPPIKTF